MTKPQRYYKVLRDDGMTRYGGAFRWSLPKWKGPKSHGRWVPGDWMPVVENPVLCRRGYHACTREQVVNFLHYGLHIYVVELRGEIIHASDKVVASEARLVEELPWGAEAARFFAVECAADVIHRMNKRSIAALETAFDFACGLATDEELFAASIAAIGPFGSIGSIADYAAAAAAYAAYADAAAASYSAVATAPAAARQKQTDRLMWWLGED